MSQEEKLFREVDFYMDGDFDAFLSKYRTMFKTNVFIPVSKSNPIWVIELFYQQLEEIIALNNNVESDPSYLPMVERSSKLLKQMLLSYFHPFIKNNIKSQPFLAIVKKIFENIQFNAHSEFVLMSQLYMISTLLPYVDADLTLAHSIVYKMIGICVEDPNNSTYSKKLRYICCNRLLYITRKISKKLTPILPDILNTITNCKTLDYYEREKMIASVVSIGNGLEIDAYKELLGFLIPNHITQLKEVLAAAVQSKFIFVDYFSLLNPQDAEGASRRRAFLSALTQIKLIWCNVNVSQRNQHVLAEYDELILNTIVQVVQIILSLYDPSSILHYGEGAPLYYVNHKIADSWIDKDKIILDDMGYDIGYFLYFVGKNRYVPMEQLK